MPRLVVIAVAIVFAFKVALLAWIGPVYSDDSGGYSDYADAMLASSHWLNDANLDERAIPLLAYRPLGYPAVIAVAKLAAGPSWPYAVTGLQIVLSLIAFIAVVEVGIEICIGLRAAVAAALAAALFQLPYDQAIMTDSLNASFIIIALAVFLRGAAARKDITSGQIVGSSGLLVAAFLFRDVLPFLMIAMLPLLLARCAVARGVSLARRFAPVLPVCLSLVSAYAAYGLWNYHRTGTFFVTSIPQTNALTATMYAAENRTEFFSGDTPLERHARPILKNYDFTEALKINEALFNSGYRAPEIARMAMQKYLKTWRDHPLAMLNLIRLTTSENILKLIVRPVEAVCELFELARLEPCADYRDLYRAVFRHPLTLTSGEAAMFAAFTVQSTVSIILSVYYFFGIPLLVVLALRSGAMRDDRPLLLVAGFWVLGVGWHLMYCEALYTTRYMGPVLPFMALGALFAGARLAERYRIPFVPGWLTERRLVAEPVSIGPS